MARHVLVTGAHHLLARAFCARRLESARVHVQWLVTGGDAVDARDLGDAIRSERRLSGQGRHGGPPRGDAGARLHVAPAALLRGEGTRVPRIDEAWHFAGTQDGERGEAQVVDALDLAFRAGSRTFHVVRETAGPAGSPLRARLADECRTRGVALREFVLPLVAGPWSSPFEATSGRFVSFLWTLQELKHEIDARCPEYFDFQAIRCRVPGEAEVELLDVRDAVREIVRLAREDPDASACHVIAGRAIPIFDLLEQVGRACGIGLLAVRDDARLDAVDRLLHDRLGEWLGPVPAHARTTTRAVPVFDELLSGIRAGQDAMLQARDVRTGGGAALTAHRIDRQGEALTYYAAGAEHDGAPVVFINALGQGLAYWGRLLDDMARRRRVIVWQLRGLEPASRALRTPDHVDDLEAILRAERIGRCHVVGWCTGAKAAVEFYLRRPLRVVSIAFLNATFKDASASAEGDTPYERNLVELCRAVDEHPILAGAVRRSLLDGEDPAIDGPDDADADALALRALTDVPRDLRPHVLEPFRCEATTVAYARQVLDFIDVDVLSRAAQVAAPVLIVCCEHDAVASPLRGRLAAGAFPRGRHVEVRGATHYCLHERPHVIAGLLEQFFRDPDAPEAWGADVRHVEAVVRT